MPDEDECALCGDGLTSEEVDCGCGLCTQCYEDEETFDACAD